MERIWFEEHGDDDIENLQYDIDHIDKNKITTIFRFSLPI